MTFRRRDFLRLAAGAVLLPALSQTAWADTYPSRPGRIVVGFPPGTSSDICARLIGQWLSEKLGQQFVVENRTGAGTNIAPDGDAASPMATTLLFSVDQHRRHDALPRSLIFNFIRDIAPVAGIVAVPNVLVVIHRCRPRPSPNSSPTPKPIRAGSTCRRRASAARRPSARRAVPDDDRHQLPTCRITARRRRSPICWPDRCSSTFDRCRVRSAFIKDGKLRALAVTATKRQPVLPDVPTVSELVPGYDGTAWFGIGTPEIHAQDIVAKLNSTINAGLADPR